MPRRKITNAETNALLEMGKPKPRRKVYDSEEPETWEETGCLVKVWKRKDLKGRAYESREYIYTE